MNKIHRISLLMASVLTIHFAIGQIPFTQSGDTIIYHTNDNLPDNFPDIKITGWNNPSPGYTFVFPLNFTTVSHYLVILDNYNTPIFYQRTKWGGMDWKYHPEHEIRTWWDADAKVFLGMDNDCNIVDTFAMGNGYSTDIHELRIMDNGNYWLMGYDTRIVDMDTVVEGGQKGAEVTGLIVQELNKDDSVLFQWRSWDHFKITDATWWIDLTDSIIDYVHGNSIAFDSDTTFLISSRNMNEITKIDRRTGDIIWRWHGENDMFEWITPGDIKFSVQHSIRVMENGHYSVFDNGTGNTPQPHFSSAIEYEIDEVNMTVKEIKRIRRQPDVHADFMGHAQRMPNGNTMCGWGPSMEASATEFDSEGNMLFDIHFPYLNYRAFKFLWETTLFDTDTDTLEFGNIYPANTAEDSFVLTNFSNREIAFNRIVHHDNTPFSIDIEAPFTLQAGQDTSFTLSFNPGEEGNYTDVFTFITESDSSGYETRISTQLYVKGVNNDHSSIDEPHQCEINIWPNPTSGDAQISAEKVIKEIHILLLSGQEIIRFEGVNEKQSTLNPDLHPGIYICRLLFVDGSNAATKLVIM